MEFLTSILWLHVIVKKDNNYCETNANNSWVFLVECYCFILECRLRHKILIRYDLTLNLSFWNYQASDAYHFFTSGQTKIQQGLLREGYDLISEALNLLNNVYGALHPEIAACLRLLARLNYIMGEYGEVNKYM